MCGINGIIYTRPAKSEVLKEQIEKMAFATRHRGPDDQDVLLLPQAAFAFNRLSIVAPTEQRSIQRSGPHLYSLCNGEIVNYKTLRNEIADPSRFGESDTSLILPLYEKFGPSFIKKLAGMFAIALYNEKNQELHLWRDPLGVKPLYYYRDDSCVLFSSEIKSIYAALPIKPVIDFAAIDHILRYRFHSGRSTVFPSIHRVLPGEHVVFSPQGEYHDQYWVLQNNAVDDLQISVESAREFLEGIVAEYAKADVPGGIFLSGGLDSSLIAALARRSRNSYQTAFSLSFQPHPVIDEKYAGLLAQKFQNRFHWVSISDALARMTLESSIPFFDEPLENPIHIGTFLLARRAHELGIKTVLTGDGSDEIFLGYERYECWLRKTVADARKEYANYMLNMKPDESEEVYSSWSQSHITPMTNNDGTPTEPFDEISVFKFERWERLQEYHCMRLDRMTMAWGVEARVPFLDHRLVEYSMGLSTKTLFGATGKSWLGAIAQPYLPPEILSRSKVRFPYLPDQWLSGDGIDWMQNILLDPSARTSGMFQRSTLERYISDHKTGKIKRGRLLWAFMTLELWLRSYPVTSTVV